MSKVVFVSYATENSVVANACCKALEEKGIQCWIAPRDIAPGKEYADAIIAALNTCRIFLLILSDKSNTSPQVKREVERAVSKDLSILTFRIDNTILSKAMEYYLSNRHWLDASNAVFTKQLINLTEAVQQLLVGGQLETEEIAFPQTPLIQTQTFSAVPSNLEPPSIPESVSLQLKARRRGKIHWFWLAGITVLVLAGLIYFFGIRKTTTTYTYIPQASITIPPTVTWNYNATIQARNIRSTESEMVYSRMHFAEPILTEISSHPPNFEDDFENPSSSEIIWSFNPEGLSFRDGVIHLNSKGLDYSVAGGPLVATDFVLTYEFTPLTPSSGGMCSNFRYSDEMGGYNFCLTLSDDKWSMGNIPADGDFHEIIVGGSNGVAINHSTKVTIIADGDEFAFYIDDNFVGYARDIDHGNDWVFILIYTPDDAAEVDIDNVQFWDLNNLQP